MQDTPKDIPMDQQDLNPQTEPKKKRKHQYQANPKNPIYSSYKSSSEERDLNEKLKKTTGYTGY